MACKLNSRGVYTSGWDGYLRLWSIKAKKCERNFGMVHDDMNFIKISNSGRFLVTSDAWGLVK
jgi:hypothetical protein